MCYVVCGVLRARLQVEEERDVSAGKLLLGKDGNEFRAKLNILTKKDHGFLKKVKDKKKTKLDGAFVLVSVCAYA